MSISMFTLAARDMGDHVESLTGEMVNGDYFPLLGLRAEAVDCLGRTTTCRGRASGRRPLARLLAARVSAAIRKSVGQTMRPPGGSTPSSAWYRRVTRERSADLVPAVFVPIKMVNQIQPDIRDQLKQRGNHSGFLKARLAPGATMAQARAVSDRIHCGYVETVSVGLATRNRVDRKPMKDIAVNPLLDSVVVPAAAALMVVVGLVLLVACANLASFLLAQARDRGARKSRFDWRSEQSEVCSSDNFSSSHCCFRGLGGIAGVLCPAIALRAVLHADLPVPIPITLDVSLDWRVLAFTVVASAIAGVFFGLVPALQCDACDVSSRRSRTRMPTAVRFDGSPSATRSSSDRCPSHSPC